MTIDRTTLRGGLGFLAFGVAMWFFPVLVTALDLPIFYLLFAYTCFFWICQASSWNLFTGYSGYFSFGQGAFYGVGVYTTAILTAKHDWSLIAAIPAGAVFAAILGLGVGLVVFRLRQLRGEIFALLTLAVAFVVSAIARFFPTIDGGNGIPLNSVELPTALGEFPAMMFRLGLIVALVAVFASFAIRRSTLGWGLFAIADDEDVAEALGVPTFRSKMMALGASTFIAGLGGAVHAIQISYVTIEDVFNVRVPLFVIIMSVLGGLRHWMGPVVGALVIYTLTDRLNRAGFEDFNQLIIGGLLIIMVLAVKDGLYGRMRERWPLTLGGLAVGIVGWAVFVEDSSAVSNLAAGLVLTVILALLPLPWGRSAPEPEEAPVEEEVGA